MHLKLTPLDIAFLRSIDHVVADIRSDESRLRAENRVLTDMLVAAEAALATGTPHGPAAAGRCRGADVGFRVGRNGGGAVTKREFVGAITEELSRPMSGQAKHTPGPWFVGAMNDCCFVIVIDKQPFPAGDPQVRDVPGVSVICKVGPTLQDEINARLIAASPELLFACEAAINALIGCAIPSGGCDDRNCLLETQALLRAAIQTATGVEMEPALPEWATGAAE